MACRFPMRSGIARPPLTIGLAWACLLGAGVIGANLVGGGPCAAATLPLGNNSTPTLAYHAAFANFYDGDYRDALDTYMTEGRGAIKSSQSRWIDSICYETMVGECYFEMGQLSKALDHYTAAVNLYLAFPTWMAKVQFPPTLRAAGASVRKQIPWATRAPLGQVATYPTSLLIAQGNIDQSDTVQSGGLIQQANLFPIEVEEIVRCTALAIRRRAAARAVAAHDAVFNELIAALSRRPGPPNHWSEAWINLELGLALAAGGRTTQAVTTLQRATLAGGEFIHPMSSVAYLELGKLAAQRGDYDTALRAFEEASYTAVYYWDPGVLEEAFRYGAMVHLAANHKGIFPPLAGRAAMGQSESLAAIEHLAAVVGRRKQRGLGADRGGRKLLDDARSAWPTARWAWAASARRELSGALTCYQQKKLADGDALLAGAMNYMHQAPDKVSLALPDLAGRFHVYQRLGLAAHRDRPLRRRAPRSAAGRLEQPIPWSAWPCW